MLEFRVDFNQEEIQAGFDATPRQIARALKITQRRGAQYAGGRLVKVMAGQSGLLQKVFRGNRVWINPDNAALGFDPIQARFAGRLRQDASGAFAGQYFFDGAFLARYHGAQSVWKRVGRSRLPIVEQHVELPQAPAAMAMVAAETTSRLDVLFTDAMRFVTQVPGAS